MNLGRTVKENPVDPVLMGQSRFFPLKVIAENAENNYEHNLPGGGIARM